MRLKQIIFILHALVFLAACQGQSISNPIPPAVTPFITGLKALQVNQATADTVRRHMGLYLRSTPYTQFESGSQLFIYLVSSGEFGQAEIMLATGESYRADVLYAYGLMSNQRVLIVPIVVGLVLPDGNYIYFSEKLAFATNGSIISTVADQQTALADAIVRLPRGRIFRLILYGMATREGPDWKKCPSILLYPPEICPVGALVEELFPGGTRTFALRLSDGFPANWLLVGWVFQEFTSDELVPGTRIDIPLPEPSQPQE